MYFKKEKVNLRRGLCIYLRPKNLTALETNTNKDTFPSKVQIMFLK